MSRQGIEGLLSVRQSSSTVTLNFPSAASGPHRLLAARFSRFAWAIAAQAGGS